MHKALYSDGKALKNNSKAKGGQVKILTEEEFIMQLSKVGPLDQVRD